MATRALSPVVGYHGGKRRLLRQICDLLPAPDMIARYVEPFVGMGAVYLNLRLRGYRGPAVLADSNACVADFWRIVHDAPRARELIAAARHLRPTEHADVYYSAMGHDIGNPARRVARFLWLTNYAYANVAPVYVGHGRGWTGSGCKLTSSAKWGKTFPWLNCVERLARVVDVLAGLPCVVLDDASDVDVEVDDVIYADPPYLGQRGYVSARDAHRETRDFSTTIFGWQSRRVIYSEMRALALPKGWQCHTASVTARASRRNDTGAIGERREYIYFSEAQP